jgi:hypothetical protein
MKQWVLLQKNVWPHNSQVSMSELAGMSRTPGEHPPCNLDLTHYDFWVFPQLKQELQEKKNSAPANR